MHSNATDHGNGALSYKLLSVLLHQMLLRHYFGAAEEVIRVAMTLAITAITASTARPRSTLLSTRKITVVEPMMTRLPATMEILTTVTMHKAMRILGRVLPKLCVCLTLDISSMFCSLSLQTSDPIHVPQDFQNKSRV